LKRNLIKMDETYLNEILNQSQRLIGLMDRNPMSETFGCFDRQYWQYTITDTPSARCQEAALTLTLLYTIKHKKNPYYKKEIILKWIKAAINFWTKIQEKNGSFNEWYPKESSYVATAFSSYAISETLLLLKIKNKKALNALKNASNWLLRKTEKRVLNQESSISILLLNLYLLTKNPKYKRESSKRIELMRKNQNSEGWWNEYNGPDIGYLSLTIDYFTKYYQKTKDKRVLPMLNKAVDFISYFIHPNLTFGGEYASRNTEYLIPSGFEFLAQHNKTAASIADSIRSSLSKRTTISPFSLDDRYLTYIGYNWLQAHINAKRLSKTHKKHEKDFTKKFPNANILIKSSERYYIIINYSKGGSFKLFRKGLTPICDSGIIVETSKEKLTSALKGKNKISISNNSISIKGKLLKMKSNVLSPAKNLLVRGFQGSLGRIEGISMYLKEKMRDRLITKNLTSNVQFSRKIDINKDRIIIKDCV